MENQVWTIITFKAYNRYKRTQDAFVGDPTQGLCSGDGVDGGGEGIRL